MPEIEPNPHVVANNIREEARQDYRRPPHVYHTPSNEETDLAIGEILDDGEVRLRVGDQWIYRGNRSSMWMLLAGRGKNQKPSGISAKCPEELWFLCEEIARLRQQKKSA